MSSTEVRIDALRACELRIPFKGAFRHASATRAETSSVWVEALANGAIVGCGESCPRPYVTGESVESARAFIDDHASSVCREIRDLHSLRGWMSTHAADIDAHPAAWCAIELALLHAIGAAGGVPIESLAGLPPLTGTFNYTAIVGDEEPEAFQRLVGQYRARGFRDFKVKLSGDVERDRRKLGAFTSMRDARVRGDANNTWRTADDAVAALEQLDFGWFALEEPVRAGAFDELSLMARTLGCRIVLDESLVRVGQLRELPGPAAQWIVNVRVSKMGGVLRALDVVTETIRRGSAVIVGAQVGETSLLTRAGLTVAHAARESLVAQEGAFGTHLLVTDVCEPALMFGMGGALEVGEFPRLFEPGLGPVAPPEACLMRGQPRSE